MGKNRNRAVFLLLMAALLVYPLLPTFAVPETAAKTVEISTAQELCEFSRNCILDSYSQGLMVLLTEDIVLTNAGFEPIPTFGGTFDGNGHTISGLSLEDSGSVQGLFRYIQPQGVIKNLTVKGRVTAMGSSAKLGGITGSNAGTISGCSFTGAIVGMDNIGGIAGINETGGIIENCTVGGVISGEHYTGGITGQNSGSIAYCENHAGVNTTAVEYEVEINDWNWRNWQNLNSTESTNTCTDTGGIAGYSSGTIVKCYNAGIIGYEHVGYNVGGIAGRQSGFIDSCTNAATVYGRKDVGGIVGQMEPYMTLQYSEDTLKALSRELSQLSALLDETLTDASSLSNGVSGRLERMLVLCDDARADLKIIIDGLTDYANKTSTAANQISEELAIAIKQGAEISNDLAEASRRMQNALEALNGALDAANISRKIQEDDAVNGTTNWQDYVAARDDLSVQLDTVSTASGKLSQTLSLISEELQKADPDQALVAQYIGQLAQPAAELAQALSAVTADVAVINRVLSPYLSEAASNTNVSLRTVLEELNAAADALDAAAQKLNSLLNTLAGYDTVNFPVLDSSVSNAVSGLNRTLAELTVQAKSLNSYLDSSTDLLIADLRRVNDQFDVIAQTLAFSSNGTTVSTQPEDYYEDISDTQQALSNPQGKVNACRNNGNIEGDVDIGGISGSMAIEYDFDPEDDVTSIGDTSTSLRYQTKAVMLSCVNTGGVTSKKNYSGGAVGRMDLGTVQETENYGTITSSGGEYIGGIAGASYSTVRNCYAMGLLRGKAYIGGISGYATAVYDCCALIEIEGAAERAGALIGLLDSTGEASGNKYCHDTLGGIDGISYAAKAQAVSYEELIASKGIPEAFSGLTLTYTAEGEMVSTLRILYGGAVTEEPAVPPKAGYVGTWEEYDRETVRYSRIVEAVYIPYATVIESQELSTGTNLPLLLLEGHFGEDAVLHCSSLKPSFQRSPNGGKVLAVYRVTATESTTASVKTYLVAPESGRSLQVWVREQNGWQRVKSAEQDGYLLFELEDGSALVCVAQSPINWALVLLIVSVIGIFLLTTSAGTVIIVRLKRRKQRESAPGAGEQECPPSQTE